MRTDIIFLLFVTSTVICASGVDVSLPTLKQPKYFENDTVQWFPEIIGGTLYDEMNVFVSIQNRYGYHLCSGTLVNLELVVTTANCLLDENGELLHTNEIRVIADDTIIVGDGSATRQVQQVTKFSTQSTSGIALIELFIPVIQTSTLAYAELSNYTVNDDQICQLIGWGASSQNSEFRLQTIDMKIVSNEIANSSQYYNGDMPFGTIAAVPLTENACFGDSGSALFCDGVINGILAYGYGCSRSGYPLIFYDTYGDSLFEGKRLYMATKPGVSKPSRPGIKYPVYYPGAGGTTSNKCRYNEYGERICNGAETIKLSMAVIVFTTFYFVFNKFTN